MGFTLTPCGTRQKMPSITQHQFLAHAPCCRPVASPANPTCCFSCFYSRAQAEAGAVLAPNNELQLCHSDGRRKRH